MILSSDWHLRMTRPRSRVDDYFTAQERKVRHILDLAITSPPLLIAGDLFHVPRPGEELLTWIIGLFWQYGIRPIVVPGQHDLPGHNIQQIHRSGIGVLAAAKAIELLTDPQFPTVHEDMLIQGVPYGTEPEQMLSSADHCRQVLIWHHMVINEPLWPGQVADKSHAILKKYPQFELIVTGDNHESFCIYETVGPKEAFMIPRFLVNPGSMMRMTAAQVNHEPVVYDYNKDNKTVTRIPLPIEHDVFDLTELEAAKAMDSNMLAFIERLDDHIEMGLDFARNLRQYIQQQDIDQRVADIIWRCKE